MQFAVWALLTRLRRRSRTVAALVAPTAFCAMQTAAVGLYSTYHPNAWPDIPPVRSVGWRRPRRLARPALTRPGRPRPRPQVGQEFFNLTSGALALLLVFRTDASYTRWDEARRQWGEVRRAQARASLAQARHDAEG